jgi:RNA recognition motif-containing protein
MNSQSNVNTSNIDLTGVGSGGSVSSTGNNNINNNSNNNSLSTSITNNKCNLIINYLPQSLKEQDFNQLFSKIGPIKTCKLMFDRQTGFV